MRRKLSLISACLAFSAASANAQNATPDGAVLISQQHALVGGIGGADGSGFPVTISQPGLYRLTSNLVVSSPDTNAIEITADNVVLDLNGFSILGPTVCPIGVTLSTGGSAEDTVTSCSPTGAGVGVSAGQPYTISSAGPVASGRVGIKVMNGTIAGMGSHGVVLGPAARLENVTLRSNGGTGALVGRGSIVKTNIAIGNGGLGFFIGNASIGQGNVSTLNKGVGMEVGSGLTIENVSHRNGTFGLVQFGDSSPHVFVNNSAIP